MPKDNRSKKIRDLKRLLQLDSIPETTRNEKERALAALESEKQSSANSREVLKMTQKYKMVKFVEHQKAVRRLSKAKKSLSIIQQQQESTESNEETSSKEVRRRRDQEINKAIEEVKNREVDVRYIENFPVLEKYISLYKDCVGPAAETTLQRRREIWEKAEKGELRKSDDGHVGKKQRREEAQIEDEEVDDFFE